MSRDQRGPFYLVLKRWVGSRQFAILGRYAEAGGDQQSSAYPNMGARVKFMWVVGRPLRCGDEW